MSFWFGDFELDQERRQLLRSGDPVPLEPKAYELLSLLLERRPRALSRTQIRDAIRPQTFVSESTLAVVVNGIRQALEDDVRHPRFIRTVHGLGYAAAGRRASQGTDAPASGSPRAISCWSTDFADLRQKEGLHRIDRALSKTAAYHSARHSDGAALFPGCEALPSR